jgi:hypothetical protein
MNKKNSKMEDDAEINNVLLSIGKKPKNQGSKQLINDIVDKNKVKNKSEYEKPATTYTDNLTKDDVEKKLEDYQKVDDISTVMIGTHLRYFIKKDDKLVFRMGGNLKRNLDLPKFIVLKNALGTEWTVQVKDTIFYKKMTIQEIKEEYEEIINELNNKIKKLKEKIKKLEN